LLQAVSTGLPTNSRVRLWPQTNLGSFQSSKQPSNLLNKGVPQTAMFESKPAVSVPMCAAKMFCIMASLQLQYPTSNTKLIYLKFQHSNSARHLCFRQVKEQAMLPFCVPCRHIGEAEVQPSSSLISALDGVIEHHHDPVALPPGKKPASDFKGGFWAPGPSWRI